MTDEGDLLTPAAIAALTGKVKWKAQARALARMGVRFTVRPDGSPVVARAFVDAMLGRYTPPATPTPDRPINWSALAAPRTKRRG